MISSPPIRCVLTSRDDQARLQLLALLPAADGAPGEAQVAVDSTRHFQTVLGFGGAFTESAARTWQGLGPQAREELLRAYFDPRDGHGYSLCRVHMGSCDFALGNYSHLELEGDVALESFSIARDRESLLPFIRGARQVAGRDIRLLASPWSPPAWMKTSRRMNNGGALLPQYRQTWARCYARFIAAYAAEGVPIWGVTVQNEPMAT